MFYRDSQQIRHVFIVTIYWHLLYISAPPCPNRRPWATRSIGERTTYPTGMLSDGGTYGVFKTRVACARRSDLTGKTTSHFACGNIYYIRGTKSSRMALDAVLYCSADIGHMSVGVKDDCEVPIVMLGKRVNQVAFVGTYLPRQCGIATFTADLCGAIGDVTSGCMVIPTNDQEEGYDYHAPVRFTIFEPDLSSYRRAAEFLNINHVDVVSLQHEYGIFGGEAGSHVLAFLQALRTPVVTTFHTVLHDPKPEYHRVLQEVASLSDRVVVLSRRAQTFLHDVYGVPEDKVDLIPHGIPDFPFVDPNFYKDQFGVEGRPVMSTFGLLSPSKGIEHVIRALPEIKKAFPNIVYLIVGVTHPYWIREEGEAYRLGLQREARELGVEDNVIFHNRFVEAEELVAVIGASDIFITPYLNEEQVSSGTLSWAVGAGKTVISTPYWYAQELLAEERGMLVPFGEHAPIAQSVIRVLNDNTMRHEMRKRAYMFGRNMTWPNVAHMYVDSFTRAVARGAQSPRMLTEDKGTERRRGELPLLRLQHLKRMTDSTGLLHHASYTVPQYDHGYLTDDNARALAFTMKLFELGELPNEEAEELVMRYLAFLDYAFDRATSCFRQNLTYGGGRWIEKSGAEDTHGRALWALGTAVGHCDNRAIRPMAGELFGQALTATRDFSSIRACAFTLLGIDEYLKWFLGDVTAHEIRHTLSAQLTKHYREAATDDWPWFEESLTYANARLSHAMIVTGRSLGDEEMTDIGFKSLEWLCGIQQSESGHFVPIGSNGYYTRGQERARFDQQPIEACATVAACLAASEASGEKTWYAEAERAFEWFLGRNDLQTPIYDPRTGGCYDTLHPRGINANQGAEATLSYLLALADMRLADKAIILKRGEISVQRIKHLKGILTEHPA